MPRLARLLAASLAVSVAPGALSLAAADDQAGSSLAGIERRIQSLQAQLGKLKAASAARDRQVEAARRTAEAARAEARAANRRADTYALTTGQSFGGGPVSGVLGELNPHGQAAYQASVALNGVGRHSISGVGQQKASALGDYGRFQLGGLTVTLGGFLDATALVRTRNEVADVTSVWNQIPYPQSPLYHEPEFRGSARNSRLALLVQGQPSATTRVAGFIEADFKAAGISSNSNESNSYAMALRNAYATVDRSDIGLHVLGGQEWSLLTLDRIGITPRQEQIPLTIDSAYVPGFTWTRNAQLRIAEDFYEHRLWAAVSFESPQTSYSVANVNSTGVIGGAPNYQNPGGSLLNANANYSDDIAPDVIGKVAVDPSFGHFELYGIARFPHDRVTSTVANRAGRDNTVVAGGGGGGFVLPIGGPRVLLQGSTLVGQGIGRYGGAQLPDETIGPNGNPIPIPEIQALIGVIAHPVKSIDLYAYVGTEQEAKRSYNETIGGVRQNFGYGNGFYSDAGCLTEGSPLACSGNTRGITQGTLGAWWRFLHGPWGTLQTGTQWSYTQRTAFSGTGARAGTTIQPKTDENVVMFSFRYLPFL